VSKIVKPSLWFALPRVPRCQVTTKLAFYRSSRARLTRRTAGARCNTADFLAGMLESRADDLIIAARNVKAKRAVLPAEPAQMGAAAHISAHFKAVTSLVVVRRCREVCESGSHPREKQS
jgi:hypothetical protein